MPDYCLPLRMQLAPCVCLVLLHRSRFRSKIINQDIKFLCVPTVPHSHLYHSTSNILPYSFTNLSPLLDPKLLEVGQCLVLDIPSTRGPVTEQTPYRLHESALQQHSTELTTSTFPEIFFSLPPYDIFFCFSLFLSGCFFLVSLLSSLLLLDFWMLACPKA